MYMDKHSFNFELKYDDEIELSKISHKENVFSVLFAHGNLSLQKLFMRKVR